MGRIIITVDDGLVQNFKNRGISGNRAILVLSCDHAAFLIHYSQGGRVVNSCTFRRSKWSLHWYGFTGLDSAGFHINLSVSMSLELGFLREIAFADNLRHRVNVVGLL